MLRESSEDRIAFPPFALYPRERRLTLHGKPVKIGARALDLLVILAGQAGELVSKNELMERVWPQQQIDESALRVHLSALRRVLGLAPGSAPSIVNETGRGYRFVVRYAETGDRASEAEPSRPPHASPAMPCRSSVLIGREAMTGMLTDELVRRRFITLAGPGGVGKTSVGVAVGAEAASRLGSPCFFLDLASLGDSRFLESALGFALVGSAGPGMSTVMRLDGLRPAPARMQGPALPPEGSVLIIDNCEHLLDASAALVERLLQTVPKLHVIATSREPLRAAGEWICRVPPLAIPAGQGVISLAEASGFAAVQLFIERAGGRVGTRLMHDADMPAIIEICRQLDGIPLAIEMAAAGLDSQSLEDLAESLTGRFARLCRGRRTAKPRHQSLDACITWSCALLSPEELRLLARLCTLDGVFSLAEAAAAAADMTADAVADALGALVSKSMVLLDPGPGRSAYRVLNVVRNHLSRQPGACGSDRPLETTAHGQTESRAGSLGFITFPGIHETIRLDRITRKASAGEGPTIGLAKRL